MNIARTHNLADHLIIIVAVILLGLAVTFGELTVMSKGSLNQLWQSSTPTKPAPANQAPTGPSDTPASSNSAATTSSPKATATKGATTTTFVHLRAGKGTTTPVVVDIEAGSLVQLRSDSDAKWQGVIYQGKTGYIFKDYLQSN